MKLKLTVPKISIRMITLLVLTLIILGEIYMAYSSLYLSLSPQPDVAPSTNIVRINRATISDIGQYLDGLDNYQSVPIPLSNSNPFKYSQ